MIKKMYMPLLLAYALIISSCATTQKMPNLQERLDYNIFNLNGNSLVLASVSLENMLDGTDGHFLDLFLVGKNNSGNYKKLRFANENIRIVSSDNQYHLVIVELPQGENYFHSVRGRIMGDWFKPFYEAPIMVSIDTKENGIHYVGNINMTLRIRESEQELRAGPITPLVDQAPIANATFDVEIVDNYERDMAEYFLKLPTLKHNTISKSILSPWKRPADDEFKPKKTHFGFL